MLQCNITFYDRQSGPFGHSKFAKWISTQIQMEKRQVRHSSPSIAVDNGDVRLYL